jgi:hypothetical protein
VRDIAHATKHLGARRSVEQVDGDDFRVPEALGDAPGDRDDLPVRQSGKMPRGRKADESRSPSNEYLVAQNRSIRVKLCAAALA